MIVKVKDLKPGHVITWQSRYALVQSVGPCDTLPARARGYKGMHPAEDYIEPWLIMLAHFREDMWVQTLDGTYALILRKRNIDIHTEVRVQTGRRGKFYRGSDLLYAMSNTGS